MNNKLKLQEYLKKIGELNYLTTILRWEMDTVAPKLSFDYLINLNSKIELQSFSMQTSEEYIRLIDNLIDSDEFNNLSKEEQIYVKRLKVDYENFKKVPKDFYEDFCKLKSNSLSCWVEAKENDDYESFKPYLQKVIEYTKRYYRYIHGDDCNIYDCMLNEYEENITSSTIDKLFDELKRKIIPIVRNLKPKKLAPIKNTLNDTEFINLAKFLLNYIGFDNNRGALGIYTHGYTTKFNNNDERITFSNRDNPIDSICTIIHEGGHGIFDQNVGENLVSYATYDVNKYALHESQSRFYENIIGRRQSFYIPIYDEIKNKLKIDIPLDKFMEYLNNAQPSLIRTEADELTYCLHIIIRYEIERDIFNNNIYLDTLPLVWNKKYEEYLGMSSKNYKDGLLQDMHWSDGSFGYFPSDLLGSIFDGMLLEKVNEHFGSIDKVLEEGRIKEITKFLNDSIHKYGGAYNIDEVACRLCHKHLEVEPLVKYFNEKYN